MNIIQASLQAALPPKKKNTSGGWISFNAPCCVHKGETKDTRQRGGVLFDADGFVYSCFNCGFKAGWKPGKSLSKNAKDLLRWFNIPDSEINKLILEALKEKDKIVDVKKELSLEFPDENLPDNSLSIKEWLENGCNDDPLLHCIEYIQKRGLTLDDYNWHWTPEPGYKDRILIPFYHKHRIVGWTGRKITEGRPKYLAKTPAGYVFNLDAQTYTRKYAIVVEGQFDAIAIGGVAIMHNEPNESQCALISKLDKDIIVVPDRDKAGSKLLNTAIERNWSASIPPWGDDVKDVADAVKKYGKIYTLATILHYKEQNKIKIELHRKKLEKINA